MRRFRYTIIIFGILVFILSWLGANKLEAYDHIVTGSNDADLDIKAVQSAVDQGGAILLKGTFDFGPRGRVNIKNDVLIAGEKDANGRHLTTVKGGFWSFHSPLPSTELPLPGPGPKVAIKDIHFDGATWSPIYFAYTSGAEISGNKMTNVKPYALKYKWKGHETLLIHAGGIIGNRYVYREKMLPGATTGELKFNNNYIDLKCENPEITMGQGPFILWTWGATIEIRGNTIRNVSRNSIESLDNYIDEDGRGSVLIAENNIVTPVVGIPFPSPTTPNGIVTGWFFDSSGGADPARRSKITIVRNFVQINGKTSAGVACLADGASILGNRIQVMGGPESKGISVLGSNAVVARNQIDGTGKWAMISMPYKNMKANGSTFAWNDVSQFKPTAGDFYCASNKTTLIGTNCKVVDKGKENRFLVND